MKIGQNENVVELPVQFDIWDTCYTLTDKGSCIEVVSPRRVYSNDTDWGLGFSTETVDNPHVLPLLRKMMEKSEAFLTAKSGEIFRLPEIMSGILVSYGWKPDDFL